MRHAIHTLGCAAVVMAAGLCAPHLARAQATSSARGSSASSAARPAGAARPGAGTPTSAARPNGGAASTPASGRRGSASAAAVPDRSAEHVYVVNSGDTLSSVAAELEVEPRELAARNYLRPPYSLRIGQRLRLPASVPPDVARELPTRAQLDARRNGGSPAASTRTGSASRDDDDDEPTESGTHRAGIANLVRARDNAPLTTNLAVGNQSLRVRMERFLRFRDGSRHGIHPRLIRALAALSDHFNGRRIIVLSGFRPQLRNTSGPRTRHSQGYAVDVRVEGVRLGAVHTFCTGLENMGCGLYPRANFVHIDVRREPASWTDNTAPGTHGRQRSASESDETVDEVMADSAPVPSREQ